MFDIGFLELFVIMVIALMVIGPDRMPEVARKIGQFLGKAKNFMNNMKENSEISSAIQEMKETINLEEEKQHLESINDSFSNNFAEIEQKTDTGTEEFSRPSFGEKENTPTTSNQYNKAPEQPTPPSEEEKETTSTPVATETKNS